MRYFLPKKRHANPEFAYYITIDSYGNVYEYSIFENGPYLLARVDIPKVLNEVNHKTIQKCILLGTTEPFTED